METDRRRLGGAWFGARSPAGAIPRWRYPAMALTAAFRPHAFTLDQALIEEVARARSVAEAALAVDVFRSRSRGEKSLLRNGLGVRA
jgi:hypothetical protein